MAGTNGRGQLEESAPRLSIQFPDSDDDEFALAALGISDGYRPADITVTQDRFLSPRSPLLPNTVSSQRAVTPPPRPSSISKSKTRQSFTLQHDGDTRHDNGGSSNAGGSSSSASNLNRLSSVSTTAAAGSRQHEPCTGSVQPSFPYNEHAQQSRDVRVSLATTVVRSERSYQGPSAPVHPYGMYPQNTVPESEPERGVQPPMIPAGFPGRDTDYVRRIGPDGEELGDMIGPDGHTEALPPYSQYPDEAFARKARLAELRTTIDGAGGVGLATRNPEFEPTGDLSRSTSQHTARSVPSSQTVVASSVNEGEQELSEKKPQKKWQVKARKKICGIVPLWALILAVTVLVVFALILGITLYALRPRHRRPPFSKTPEGIVIGTATRIFDATPMTTLPPDLSPLPTGTYALPIAAPSAVQNSCLQQTQQSKAWSCMLPQSPLQMQILDLAGARNELANKEIILDYGKASMTNFPYGTQPPVLGTAQVMSLVVDTQDSERGPAWFFQTIYNKVVVVPEDLLSSPYDQKRDLSERDGHSHHVDEFPINEKAIPQPGEAAWFCYWNGTMLEAFLYVNQTSSEAAHGSAHESQHHSDAASNNTISSTSSSTASASTSTATSADEPWGPEHEALSAYPKVLKFQERRIPQGAQAIPPYCVKKFIAADGSAQEMKNSTGQVITLYLNEAIPTEFAPMRKRGVLEDNLPTPTLKYEKRQSETDAAVVISGDRDRNCGCAWLAT